MYSCWIGVVGEPRGDKVGQFFLGAVLVQVPGSGLCV